MARGRKRDEGVLSQSDAQILEIQQLAIERYGEEGCLQSLEYIGLWCGSKMCVYFARMGSTPAHKIGMAYHADSRMKSLQTGSPLPIKLVAWINAPTRASLAIVERETHKQADRFGARASGEWFNLDKNSIRKVIDAVVDAAPGHVMGVNYEL